MSEHDEPQPGMTLAELRQGRDRLALVVARGVVDFGSLPPAHLAAAFRKYEAAIREARNR